MACMVDKLTPVALTTRFALVLSLLEDGGAPIVPERRRQLRINNNTIQLALDNVHRDDAGLYTVTARSPLGSVSRDVELRVGVYEDGDEPPAFLRRLNDLSVKVGTRTRFLVEIRSSSELTYRIDIAAIQEMRWTGTGILQKKEHDIYYSCNPNRHEFITAFLVSKRIKNFIIGFKAINDRLCILRIKGKFFNISLINVHAPTEEKDEEIKDLFYEDLERAYDNCAKNDIKIIIGDMNAQIGKEICYQDYIGKHSLHDVTNDNGLRLISLAASKDLIVGSTCFNHKNIHKATWISPNGHTTNQIDHVIIDRRHFTNLMDSTSQARKCGTTAREALKSAAESTLGISRTQERNDWFDQDCKKITDEKNEAFRTMQHRKTRTTIDRYKNLRREEKRIHRKKKRDSENDMLERLESHMSHGETRKFYHQINSIRKEFKPRINYCNDKEGNLLTNKEGILLRWVEHFRELLEGEPTNNIELEYRNEELVEPPSIDEVKISIEKLRNHRSPGSDGIPAELFKHGGEQLTKVMREIVCRIWSEEQMPEEWSLGLICPLHKKGNQLECNNYRGITLLNTAYKILSNILHERLKPYTEMFLGEYQAGFRPGRSTINQIFTLRQILEKAQEFNIDMYHIFVDFKAAYDSVLRPSLYNAMNELGIPKKLICLIKVTMAKMLSAVKIQNDSSTPFQIHRGLRQGDALACQLFNVALEKVVRDANLDSRGTIFNRSVQILAYADDGDIITRTRARTAEILTELVAAAERMGLHINQNKTKFMATNTNTRAGNVDTNLIINDQTFEAVNEFVYLGTSVNPNNNTSEEIKRRIIIANRCYYGLSKYLANKRLSQKTRIRLYRTLIVPVLTYGSEAWTLTKTDESAISIFERKVLRKIFGAVCENGIWRRRYNFELQNIYKHTFGGKDITTIIKRNRLQWAGHVARAPESNMIKKILTAQTVGMRRRGRPKLRWMDGVTQDAGKIGVGNWKIQARDRTEWRRKLEKVEAL
ncbi:unnamed protein product [Diabrotica balteata]|uniref:Reverse transcriptase domain-containing protein n=1 Tax=Diabrotica balteata TaxID=107213 RepID=A0A9N9TBG4_DIABA|nr:unnamed protein product [Diabrotica balteata]